MYIQLMHRHYGLHEPIKHIEILCEFSDVYLAKNCGVMNELICRQRKCTFYRTKKEFKEGQKKYPYGGLK